LLIFKTKAFDRWTTKIELRNETLRLAIMEIEEGRYEANLGGFLYKKRIALGDKGKSGVLELLLLLNMRIRQFLFTGFLKTKELILLQRN
jgi:hypothetical protein